MWGGFSIPAMAAPFAFIHVVSYVGVFFFPASLQLVDLDLLHFPRAHP